MRWGESGGEEEGYRQCKEGEGEEEEEEKEG